MDMNSIWEYQQADMALEKFQRELKDTPTRRRLVKLQRFLQASQAKIGELESMAAVKKNTISELEAQNRALDADMEDLNKDLGYYSECDEEELDQKELEQMVKDCEKTYEAIANVKKELARIKAEIETTDRSVKEMLAKMISAKEEYDTLKVEHKKELAGGSEEVEALTKQLEAAEKEVPAVFVSEYKRIKGFRPNPVAVLANNRCSGCNMQLPAGVTTTVAASDKPVTCENCGRILILR
ncbi:MAG: hypothetical protein IJP03_00425 [Christensenellaceae bacterium]|nr:hypothetical protein [Christensenellaceae bacterium]